MTRQRRHKSDNAAIAARANRFKALQTELMQASELANTPANRQRVETVALIDLATDSVREAILRGEVVEVGALERLAAAKAGILPAANNPSLTVHFVDGSDVCINCKGPLPPKAERVQTEPAAEAVQADNAAPRDQLAASPTDAPAPAAAPTLSAPPVNVVPLRSVHNRVAAPIARHDEPWRSSIASEFRRFDIPENF